jgi:hypothetical protein
MTNETVKVKDIKPNPFRNLDRYPIKAEKVAALQESMEATGFWENVVARRVNGAVELAYGHHRLEALMQSKDFGPDATVNLHIRDLDDQQMLQIMARENMEEWHGTSAVVMQETVRATVQAFADGKVELPAPGKKARTNMLRRAPTFRRLKDDGDVDVEGVHIPGEPAAVRHAPLYTAQTLGAFLGLLQANGKAKGSLLTALQSLELIEEGITKEAQFDELSCDQAGVLTKCVSSEMRRWQNEADRAASAAAQADAAGDAEEERGHLKNAGRYRQKRVVKGRVVAEVISKTLQTGGSEQDVQAKLRVLRIEIETPPPDINKFVRSMATQVGNMLFTDTWTAKFDQLVKHQSHADPDELEEFKEALGRLSARAQGGAKRLDNAKRLKDVKAVMPKFLRRT